ncbi:MAG: cation:proton antiporter [Deltaproteobacteria bacterium]|nr:cation:proton antiporter [Deltaproteobacteria bacterium]
MTEHLLIGIASVFVIGVGAQWISWRLKVPSILLLLLSGFLAGPVFGVVNPDLLLGNLLLPIVSLSVAVILFEGGLSLRISELKGFGGVVRNLVTIGVIVMWAISTAGAYFILGLDLPLSILFGSVLVVTGPTVIIPLLRHVRPRGHLGSILKWEGIVVDPIGAMLAVLVFEVIITIGGGMADGASMEAVTSIALTGIVKTLFFGIILGFLGATLIVTLLKKYWIPDYLQNPVILMIVIVVFAASNHLQTESGLLAVTAMGIMLANQHTVTVKHIVEFKENLRVLLISGLFVILSARLSMEDLSYINLNGLIFLVLLIVVARPVSVYVSTIASGLNLKERLFLMSIAPRGIVAAAIASIFALRLAESGYVGSELFVPLTFLVIIGTVTVYGLGALPVARLLGVSKSSPQGLLIVGCHKWAREMASVLSKEGFEVLLVDTNWSNVTKARLEGLPAYYGSILSERFLKEVDLGGMGRLLAVTFNDNVNSLAAVHLTDTFGRMGVYQLIPEHEAETTQELQGRFLFGEGATYVSISKRLRAGGAIKSTKLSEEFDFEAFKKLYKNVLPLFIIDEKGSLTISALDEEVKPKVGHHIISLVEQQVQAKEEE